jgi:hypothetical protein
MLRQATCALAFAMTALATTTPAIGDITVSGTLKKWHPITVDNTGATAVFSEAQYKPNPFLDFRYNVIFTSPGGTEYTVPGYFAGDGQGNGIGSVWRARFSADEAGEWQYRISFQSGVNLAVANDEGTPLPSDGETGTFTVAEQSADDPGFLAHGRLGYTGEHYLKFADGPHWIKGGVDSPENFFGYAGFDNTFNQPGGANTGVLFNGIHHYEPHIADWQEGDPLFTNSANPDGAKGIIGAVNYLAGEGINSIYFLPMNLGGDGRETYPFIRPSGSTFDNTHYDISKLYQWQIVLDHMQRKGIAAHFVLAEIEEGNSNWFDNGELGIERKLFYREMIARFSHLMAIKWNLSEESRFGERRHKEFAAYINSIDWADFPVAVHGTKDRPFVQYDDILGDENFKASSIQFSPENAGAFVEEWRQKSTDAGWPWVIDMDEVGPAPTGMTPDNTEALRKSVLYPVYFGGGNIEWYFGYHALPLGGDMRTEDFRSREAMYRYMKYAREMMQAELPFWAMEPSDDLFTGTANAEVFAQPGVAYAVYLPDATTTGLVSVTPEDYTLRWFNPRTGEFEGDPQTVNADTSIDLGAAPSDSSQDWVALIQVIADEPTTNNEGNGDTDTVNEGDTTDTPTDGTDPADNTDTDPEPDNEPEATDTQAGKKDAGGAVDPLLLLLLLLTARLFQSGLRGLSPRR